jgi:uncharacterized protein (DUF4415 family)
MEHRIGDKVKLKNYNGSAARGVVEEVHGDVLLVRLDDSGSLVDATPDLVRNFSLAARKAWKNMPCRHVGRPKGARHCDRISVTLRIDRELWERFREGEAEGIIKDRTATINAWLREMFGKLKHAKDCRDASKDY